MTEHLTPWRVEYWQRYESWHEKSEPFIVDAKGRLVTTMPQNVAHPGLYDELADKTAHQIVSAVNYRAQQKEWAKQALNQKPMLDTPRKTVINE